MFEDINLSKCPNDFMLEGEGLNERSPFVSLSYLVVVVVVVGEKNAMQLCDWWSHYNFPEVIQ